MNQRWMGPVVVLAILGGVALILAVNLNVKGTSGRVGTSSDNATSANSAEGAVGQAANPSSSAAKGKPAGFREYPIGDEVERDGMRIAAVWLPMVQMAGMPAMPAADMIHIEADIHAIEGNVNGCPRDEFVPYLNVRYAIVPQGETARSVEPLHGDMMPMVASDGWHYGASIPMPRAGKYRLTYSIAPPTAAGRHSDPATGVAPWWKPFEVSFDWDYERPPHSR